MNIQDIKTKSGKTIKDFSIPEKLLTEDEKLVTLVMQSESMDDGEKQYWFNLTEAMNEEQVEKLRDILVREKQKLSEIDAKYNKKEEDPEVVKARVEQKAQRQAANREKLRAKEQAEEAQEAQAEEDILKELETI